MKADTRYVLTSDGWELALHHYPGPETTAPAVLVCSGYGCNRYFVDYDDRYSLARFLARNGFDAWVVELRGRGRSYPTPECSRPNDWTFDDLARIDVPTVIGFVQQQVGHRRLCWIGHSMGGMVLYAYLATAAEGDPLPAAAVTMASPVIFPSLASQAAHTIGKSLLSLPLGRRVPQRAALGVLWHLVGWTRALDIGMNPDNVDRAVVGAALRRAISNVSRAKLKQLADWSTAGAFTSIDGRIDYRAGLRRVRTPILAMAGACDRLAPPDSVALACDLVSSTRKRFVVCGRAGRFSTDYGHVDVVFGRRAPDEIYPVIADWAGDTLAAKGG